MKRGKIVRKQLYLFTPLQICIVLRGQYHITIGFPPAHVDSSQPVGWCVRRGEVRNVIYIFDLAYLFNLFQVKNVIYIFVSDC